MTHQLHFDRRLYSGEAIDQATKVFAGLASFELSESEDSWIVALTCERTDMERRIVGEFKNHALGLTIQRKRVL